MGISGSKVDNASSGGITCGIKANGQLKDCAYTAKGLRYEFHPDSKLKFSEIIVPGFEEICEKVKRAHPQLPNYRLLSWDIAIDSQDEPVLLEVNMRFGELDFHQLNNGPVFGADTERILNEVFHK